MPIAALEDINYLITKLERSAGSKKLQLNPVGIEISRTKVAL
jgi:hypothetical protein